MKECTVRLKIDNHARRQQRIMTGLLAAALLVTAACTSSGNSAATSTTMTGTSTAKAPASGSTGSGTTSPGTGSSVTSSAGAEPAYAAKVTAGVEKAMKDNVIPGAVVLISSPDQGEWTGTFGTGTWAAQVPLTVDDHFRIGSNTKTMTSTVILQLVQEGKLALDDPISKYIPNVPGGDTVTIANLSEMRSGLYSYSFDTGFNNTLDQYPQKAWAPQELLDIAFSHPVNSPPGGDFDYSNTNIILLGLVIEKLTGMTASEAFQERIFTPLGLRTHCSRKRRIRRSRARTHRVTPSVATPRPSRPTPCPRRTSSGRWPEPCCRATRRWPTLRGDGLPAGRSRPSRT